MLIEDNAGDVKRSIALMSRVAVADHVIAAFGVLCSALSLPTALVANATRRRCSQSHRRRRSHNRSHGPSIVETPTTQTTAIGAVAVDQLHVRDSALVYDRGYDA